MPSRIKLMGSHKRELPEEAIAPNWWMTYNGIGFVADRRTFSRVPAG